MITTDIIWPAQLPYPQFSTNRMQPVQSFMRSRMASGRTRQRRLFTSVPTEGSVEWIMRHGTQSTAFEAWFKEVLLDGAEWFMMPRRTPILALQAQVTRFTSMPVAEPISHRFWLYSATVETWGRPVDIVPAGWGHFPEYLAGSSIIDVAMNRNWPEAS